MQASVRVAWLPDPQQRFHLSLDASVDRGLAAIAAVADQLSQRSTQSSLVLVEHSSNRLAVRFAGGSDLDCGDDIGLATVN
jgi:hypothetical protein